MENNNNMQDIFSKSVRAGKRTYFFDVKETKSGEYYITLTESKKRLNGENGKFFYEKHKLFLYKEDFEKFSEGLNSVINYIKEHQEVEERVNPSNDEHQEHNND
jgi:hypothetical protein